MTLPRGRIKCSPEDFVVEELPAYEPGTIYFEGGGKFEYHNDAAKTADSRNAQGWSTLGDVGYLDSDGFVFLTDRKAFMIISGGVNIYPAEIENVLIGMAGVRDCAVFGIPDHEYGERLCACVEPESGSIVSASAVQDYLRERLANFKVPKEIKFLDALPREASGKIFKRKLRDPYWEGHLRSAK